MPFGTNSHIDDIGYPTTNGVLNMKLIKEVQYEVEGSIPEGQHSGSPQVHSKATYSLSISKYEMNELIIDLSKVVGKRQTTKNLLACLMEGLGR